MNNISSWQAQLSKCNNEFERIIKTFTKEDDTEENRSYITRLETVKREFQAEVDNLYMGLGIVDAYPALNGVNPEFVKALLLCRDTKIELRRVATCYLSEMASIDDGELERK